MRVGSLLWMGLLLCLAACGAYQPPPPRIPEVSTTPPPPITGTVVVQPQP